MNIEEAIKELNSFKLLYMEGISDNGMKAIDIAISALKTIQKENNQYYIGLGYQQKGEK